jgi:hypothetical protein
MDGLRWSLMYVIMLPSIIFTEASDDIIICTVFQALVSCEEIQVEDSLVQVQTRRLCVFVCGRQFVSDSWRSTIRSLLGRLKMSYVVFKYCWVKMCPAVSIVCRLSNIRQANVSPGLQSCS